MELIYFQDQVAQCNGKVGDILFWMWELNFLKSIPRADWLTIIMKIFTYLGEAGAMWIVLSIVLAIFAKTRKTGFTMMLSMIITVIVGNVILKNCFARFRPCWTIVGFSDGSFFNGEEFFNSIKYHVSIPNDYSFPSGHTMNGITASMCILFCTIKNKKNILLGVGSVVLACIIAFSRMYLLVHWPTDIMVGALVGLIFAIISFFVIDKKLWPYIDKACNNLKKAIDRKKQNKVV